jgi:hypothetical protein
VRLTRRGRALLATIAILTLWAWIIGAFTIGQHWKEDRLGSGECPIDCTSTT